MTEPTHTHVFIKDDSHTAAGYFEKCVGCGFVRLRWTKVPSVKIITSQTYTYGNAYTAGEVVVLPGTKGGTE